MQTEDTRWLTGFTEGDGCPNLTLSSGYCVPTILWSQKYVDVLEYIKTLLNYGNLYRQTGVYAADDSRHEAL